jgi:hypothetical protein
MTSTTNDSAIEKLDAFLEQVPTMPIEDQPFDRAIELALAAEYPDEWVALLNGHMVGMDMKLTILSLAMRHSEIKVESDSMTITTIAGIGKGNVIETGPCP